jgi:hypothetical protein
VVVAARVAAVSGAGTAGARSGAEAGAAAEAEAEAGAGAGAGAEAEAILPRRNASRKHTRQRIHTTQRSDNIFRPPLLLLLLLLLLLHRLIHFMHRLPPLGALTPPHPPPHPPAPPPRSGSDTVPCLECRNMPWRHPPIALQITSGTWTSSEGRWWISDVASPCIHRLCHEPK